MRDNTVRSGWPSMPPIPHMAIARPIHSRYLALVQFTKVDIQTWLPSTIRTIVKMSSDMYSEEGLRKELRHSLRLTYTLARLYAIST